VTTPTDLKAIAHLLAGDESGWQSRFAALLGISRGYAHNLLTGERPLTETLYLKLVIAVRKRAEEYRERAAELDGMAAELGTLTMADVAAMPPMTDEEYERQSEEAEAIVNEMAGVTGAKEGTES
jgi:hypothetical protein